MKDATTNRVFKQLTLREIKNLSKIVLRKELDYLYDDSCNIDPILNPTASDIIHKNISLIESVLIHKEY